MSQRQMTVEEETQGAYRSALPAIPSETAYVPASETITASPVEEVPLTAQHVRPDELMAALAAIGARKNKTPPGTVVLGDILKRLGADITPEEIWQEVYFGRLKERKSIAILREKAARRRKRFWKVSASLFAIFTVAILLRVFLDHDRQMAKTTATDPIPLSSTRSDARTPFTPTKGFVTSTPKTISLLDVLRGGGMVRMSQENVSGLRALLNRSLNGDTFASAELSKATIDPTQYTQDSWMVLVKDGRFYLRGWIVLLPGADKVAVLAKKVRIFNRDDHPAMRRGTGQPITIPVDGIRDYSSQSDGTFSAIEAQLTRLDGVAWKSWQPLRLPDQSGLPSSKSGAEL